MSESKSNKNPTYALGTLLWVKLLKRVWWPGTVIDPITIPQELKEYVKKVEPISCVVKFNEEDDKYHVVELNEEVYLYSCDRKIEFLQKGLSLYENQKKGFAVVGKFNMEFFMKEVISIEKLIGGDECIFKKLKEEKEKIKSIVKELFAPTNTKKSKKKEAERKSLPAPKTPKTPNQPKPKLVSKPRTSTQSQVGKTYTAKTGYSCHSEAGCNFTTNRYENLKRHVATHKKDKDEVTTSKLSNSSTPNKRKNLKTKPSEIKKQKLQEELLKDWDNDGEDEDEEINTSGVQSSSNFAQSSNEEVLQTIFGVKSFGNVVQSSNEEVLQTIIGVQSSGNVVQSSNEEIVQTMNNVLSSNNVAQSSNEEIVQTKTDLLSSSNVVQSSNEEVIPISKVLSNKNDTLPIISKDISRNKEVQETSTCSPNKVFDFNENDNNTPVVELRQSKSDCSSTVDNDISETFESLITPDFISSTIFEASPSELVLVEKSTENVIDKPHGIQSNELVNEIDNQTKSTELLLEKTDNTLDQINNFENSLSCISNNINSSDILTEDDNVVIGESELSECGSLNKTASQSKDIKIETNDVGIPLVENMPTETEDEKVNQLNCTTIDENIPIENSCSVESNKTDCEDIIIEKDEVPTADWFEGAELKRIRSEILKVYFVDSAVSELPPIKDDVLKVDLPPISEIPFRSEIQDSTCRACSTFGSTNYVFGDEYEVYIPKSLLGPIPIIEENDDPDRAAALYRATLEKLFAELDLFDNNWTQHSSPQ